MSMLKDKVIIITGGAGLLGKTFAQAIVQQQGVAIIADTNLVAAKELAADLQTNGGKAEAVEFDITSKTSINTCIGFISKKYGKIDALVNNAYPRNKNYGRKFYEVEFSDFCDNLNLNLGGYFLTSQQFAVFFEKQGYGNIVNISSIYGVIPPKFEIYENTNITMPVEYAVIKSGLIHLTKYMAKQFKGKNIRINAISPGGISNGQPDEFIKNYKKYCLNKGMLDGEDISGTLVYLLSDLSTFVNGQNIIVDDGFTL